jgi:hypothetical protein
VTKRPPLQHMMRASHAYRHAAWVVKSEIADRGCDANETAEYLLSLGDEMERQERAAEPRPLLVPPACVLPDPEPPCAG